MTTVLYRKYRPKSFTDVIGQEIIVKTLSNALAQNEVAGSYLFTGPRGTGKTTLARIFATALNCQKRKGAVSCGTCAHCLAVATESSLDIIEIDAASYTGVDNIRSLRETMTNTPLLGSHKIFIIDEVHMLSIGAFNALLKIMEEPPAHVVFVLATTELHKVPKTIVSRCQRFDLRKLTSEEIVQKLTTISKSEKIKAESEALALIALASGGALRDAESILTQLITLTKGNLTAENVRSSLGMSDSSALYDLLQNFTKGDGAAMLQNIQSFEQAGKDCLRISEELVNILRSLLLFSVTQKFNLSPLSLLSKEEQTAIRALSADLELNTLCALIEDIDEVVREAKSSVFGFLPLEIALIRNLVPMTTPIPTTHKTPDEEPPTIPPNTHDEDSKKESPKTKVTTNPSPAPTQSHSSETLETIQQKWQAIVRSAQKLNASLSVSLQSARPISVENNHLSIEVKYQFHKERLEEPSHRLTLEQAFVTILGSNLSFSVVESTKNKESTVTRQEGNPLVSEALALLGGQVL